MLNIRNISPKKQLIFLDRPGEPRHSLDYRSDHPPLDPLSPRALHTRFLGKRGQKVLLLPEVQSGTQGCVWVSMRLSKLILRLLFLLRSPVIILKPRLQFPAQSLHEDHCSTSPLGNVTFNEFNCKSLFLFSLLNWPVQLRLLGGHLMSPVLRVSWFWQEMLAGRFGLMAVQVLVSSLNLFVPQDLLQ